MQACRLLNMPGATTCRRPVLQKICMVVLVGPQQSYCLPQTERERCRPRSAQEGVGRGKLLGFIFPPNIPSALECLWGIQATPKGACGVLNSPLCVYPASAIIIDICSRACCASPQHSSSRASDILSLVSAIARETWVWSGFTT